MENEQPCELQRPSWEGGEEKKSSREKGRAAPARGCRERVEPERVVLCQALFSSTLIQFQGEGHICPVVQLLDSSSSFLSFSQPAQMIFSPLLLLGCSFVFLVSLCLISRGLAPGVRLLAHATCSQKLFSCLMNLVQTCWTTKLFNVVINYTYWQSIIWWSCLSGLIHKGKKVLLTTYACGRNLVVF